MYAYLTSTFVGIERLFLIDPRLKRYVTGAGLEEKYNNQIARYEANKQQIVPRNEEEETTQLLKGYLPICTGNNNSFQQNSHMYM